MSEQPLYGAIEGGGTKFICAIGSPDGHLLAQERVATTTPEETLAACVRFFQQTPGRERLRVLGVASFGPLDPVPGSPTYGHILKTPKAGWEGVNLAGILGQALGLPVVLDTDVNAAVMAEARWGAGQGLHSLVYYTIGTGIGGGAIVDGALLHGALHTEMGHTRIPRHPSDSFAGVCPFHGDCLEGLATGPAIAARWGVPAEQLPEDHPAWDLEAFYLAQMLHNTVCLLVPQRVILGGGVMSQAFLLPRIRAKLLESLGGYMQLPQILEHIDDYIVASELEGKAGLYGALALALKHD